MPTTYFRFELYCDNAASSPHERPYRFCRGALGNGTLLDFGIGEDKNRPGGQLTSKKSDEIRPTKALNCYLKIEAGKYFTGTPRFQLANLQS